MSDYKPLTVVDDETACSTQTLLARIKANRTEHGDLLQRYHNVWYESGHTWHFTHFLGVGMMKCPNDLWIYQDLMARFTPSVVVETGTYQGGSALWFAFLMDMLRIKDGRVITVDIADYRKHAHVLHPKIMWLEGNSADPQIAEAIEFALPETGCRLFVLDSDHSAEHVKNELELYAPMTRVGDWIVVEDTNISWSNGVHDSFILKESDENGPTRWQCSCGVSWFGDEERCPKQEGDRGARGGVEDYLNSHPGEFVQDLLCERYLLTMNPGGWLQRVRECNHV